MSVQKFNSNAKYNPNIEREPVPFTQVNTNVIKSIKNLEAGFVWIYLLSHTEDWTVIKSHLKNHFKLGDNKIKSIFAYLNKCNLIEYIQTTNEQGKFGKSDIRILNGDRFASYPQEKTAGSISAPPVFRTCGSGELLNKETTKQRKKREPARKKRAPLSDNFIPNEENALRCQDLKLNLIDELKSFKERHKGAKTQYEFERWIKMSHEYMIKNNKIIKNNEIRSTVPDYGPGHPQWEMLHGTNGIMMGDKSHGSEVSGNSIRGIGVRKAEDYLSS